MGGSNSKKISAGNGLSGSGKGHPPAMGVTGPGCNFTGTVNPQDTGRTVSNNNTTDTNKRASGNSSAKPGKTGGMSRKGKGTVGY